MSWRNTSDTFGWVTRLIHWSTAASILGMLAFGTYLARMEPSLSTLWLFALHKSIGLSLLGLVVLRLVWHRISPPPPSLSAGVPLWQRRAARAIHPLLYVLMLAVPLTGWIASAATGIDVVFFGHVVPRIAPVSEVWEHLFFAAHGILTKLLLLTVIVHVIGALHRQIVHHDATLRRMVRG